MAHGDAGDERVDATKVATARRLRGLHQQQTFPEPEICGWCLKRWPCPDRRWAERVLRTSGASGVDPTAGPEE